MVEISMSFLPEVPPGAIPFNYARAKGTKTFDSVVERIQIFVETYVVLWRHYLSIDNTIICEEAHH